MSNLPIVALIGQTNAGKSSLLNRFARKNIAIVAREAGTTRDNVVTTIDQNFLLIDTAGLKTPENDFETTIQDQIGDAIAAADLILFTLDSTKYPDQKDLQIARDALKSHRPVFLVLNKSDLTGSLPMSEFLHFGIKPNATFRTSATTGNGIEPLKTAIIKTLNLDEGRKIPESTITKLALIGRPNVGKSSLFNSIAKKQQALVSSKQGTTRDINRVQIKYHGEVLEILDTAGLRKQGKREVGIEKFSALRTLAAIEESDLCALLIDATAPHNKLEQALAGQIVDAGKSIILVLTKVDLLENSDQPIDNILDQLERDFKFIPYAPVLITSSLTGRNVTKLFELTSTILKNRAFTFKTTDLNCLLTEALLSHPPAGLKNTHPKPKYIVQTDNNPPWFVVHGHELQLLHWSYKRFLERKIREFHPFIGTPIFFSFKNDGSNSKNRKKP